MLPSGKLYVPGAEKLIPNIKRLTDAARQGRVLIVGDVDAHTSDDLEFERFPAHCVRDTPGADIIAEARAEKVLVIPNRADAAVPEDLSAFQQIILEKQTLDAFDNPNTEVVLERIAAFTDVDAEFFVFGVATEYCVRLAAKGLLDRGRHVALVRDAIEALGAEDGPKAIEEVTSLGARLVTTDQALAAVDRTTTHPA